jgi:hypothetical protein
MKPCSVGKEELEEPLNVGNLGSVGMASRILLTSEI